MSITARIALVVSVVVAFSVAIGTLAVRASQHSPVPPLAVWLVAFAIIAGAVILAVHLIASRFHELHAVLGNALSAFKDGDFSLRLTATGERELAELKRLYNELADAVRNDRRGLREKEILLDTILQRTPVAVALLDRAGRVVYSNGAARDLLTPGARLNERLIAELSLPDSLHQALMSEHDSIITIGDETLHITQRIFHLNAQRHRLLLLERLTPELRRQEVVVWKKAIRVINHEINNTIAPVSSLFHSARLAQERPEHRHRLSEIYGLIDERLTFLRTFLEAYAEYARLPAPRKERVRVSDVLAPVRTLYPFRVEGNADLEISVDRSQMQQVMINLVKNAHEAGSPPDEVVVSVQRTSDDCVLQVLDRGSGMREETLRQALVPFFSTKAGGSGVGLALSNEIVESHGGRLRLEAREGGGTTVTCWIPMG